MSNDGLARIFDSEGNLIAEMEPEPLHPDAEAYAEVMKLEGVPLMGVSDELSASSPSLRDVAERAFRIAIADTALKQGISPQEVYDRAKAFLKDTRGPGKMH